MCSNFSDTEVSFFVEAFWQWVVWEGSRRCHRYYYRWLWETSSSLIFRNLELSTLLWAPSSCIFPLTSSHKWSSIGNSKRIDWCWHWENEVNSQRGDADAIQQNERCLWQSTWFPANDETDRLPLSPLTQGIKKQYQGPKIWVRNCPFPFWKVLEFRLCNMVHFAPKVFLVYSIFQKFCAYYLASKGNLLWVHWTMSFSFNPNFISIWRTRERLPERTKPHSTD